MLTKEDICHLAGIAMEELDGGTSDIRLIGITDDLPEGLSFCSLTLIDCHSLSRLPGDLKVQYLEIIRCPNLQELPLKLHVKHLLIEESDIEELPEDFSCSDSLILKNCPRLRKIPDSCIAFANDLVLCGCSSISKLPDIRIVFGNLNIAETLISILPSNIKIGGYLIACGSSLETLPEGIRIGGSIDLSRCTKFKSLPAGLVVNGSLNLSGSTIIQLPDRMVVGGILNLVSTNIRLLPSDLLVKGQIFGPDMKLLAIENKRDFPKSLPHLIWESSGYFQYANTLFRIIYQDDNCWKVLDPYTVVSIMLEKDDISLEDDIYIVTDGAYSYGMGSTLQEASKNISTIQ